MNITGRTERPTFVYFWALRRLLFVILVLVLPIAVREWKLSQQTASAATMASEQEIPVRCAQ